MKKMLAWLGWVTVTLAVGGYLTMALWRDGEARAVFLPGATTHGHYQIEMNCAACHTPMMGVKQDACMTCHEAELERADDSHPPSKFTDPRNAERLEKLDARWCITCHLEHRPEHTRAMGVTMPQDYCYHCHDDIAQERPNHAALGFDTCATAGCHNFHDNRSLNERFLAEHLDAPAMLANRLLPGRNKAGVAAALLEHRELVPPALADAPAVSAGDQARIERDWATSAHARADVNCRQCHESAGEAWTDRPSHSACSACHQEETDGFLGGRHGMRLAQGLGPMTPGQARLPMKPTAAHRELSCASCHDAHTADTRVAAVTACLSCHDDPHSRAFEGSPHYLSWLAEQSGATPAGSGVSCATCHLPRVVERRGGVDHVSVQHNQNEVLRPNEKMIRAVCINCHGVPFAIDALADPDLISNNFRGRPAAHVQSVDMVRRKLEQRQATDDRGGE